MEPTAIATNELGMHVIVRPVPNSLLLDGTVSEIGTEDVNALMTARRPASLADAIGGLPPLLPPSADSVGDGKRLYSLDEVRSGSGGLRLDSPVPELLQYESQLDVNTTLDSSLASAKSAARRSRSAQNGSRTHLPTSIRPRRWSRLSPSPTGRWPATSSP